jgi:RTC4-like domain
MIEFGSKLHQRALTDGLMRAIGIGHYIVTVLVPELAAMLIKEDMKVCDESA